MDTVMILWIALAVVTAVYAVLILYFLSGWLGSKRFTNGSLQENFRKSVSVIIPVRNEEKHIAECLESIFKQDYPKHLFEVIVVDDFSTDDTRKIVRETTYPALRLFDLQHYLGARGEKKPNKKEALAIGIKNAQGELIVTTDGDTVRNEKWLSTLVAFYELNNFKLITAPVLIKPAYTPMQLLQQADVANLMGITAATIHKQSPTMCSGANLLYSKETFQEMEGFKGNHDVPSGDDVFLMQKIFAKYPQGIGFVKSYDAVVFTKPERGLFSFIGQRIRWVSKSVRFANWWVKVMLVYAYLFNLLALAVSVASVYMFLQSNRTEHLLPMAIVLGAKFFFDLLFNIPVLFFFKQAWLLLLLPFIEVMHIFYIVFIGLLGISGRYRWRGRKVS